VICKHVSIKAPRYGSSSECSNCGLPIIFTGERWEWEYGIDRNKVRKMRTAYDIDRATGKYS